MNKLSYKVALGGVVASLSILTLFLTGFGPFFTYLCPMIAGGLLIAVVIEVSRKWAAVAFAAISALAIFITPDKEAALLFIFLFGHYPILKSVLEKIPLRFLEWAAKMLVFNACAVSAYALLINVFGMSQFLESLGDWGEYGVLLFLAAGNVTFVLYDLSLSSIIDSYINWFRPKFLRKLK